MNIEGQLLGTLGSIGYVVTDVRDLPQDAITELQELSETIRLRVI